ncbi:MAG TPA: hypothetical protein PKG52_05410 [bacterium]|nr:hypothetical protein [bacterium]HPS30231.1 hypothetical protein [bacterium]
MKSVVAAIIVIAFFNSQLLFADGAPFIEVSKRNQKNEDTQPAKPEKKEEKKVEQKKPASKKAVEKDEDDEDDEDDEEETPAPVVKAAEKVNEQSPEVKTPVMPVGEPEKLLVQKITGVDVEESVAKTIEEAIVLNIGQRSGFSVVTSAELESAVKFTEKQAQMGCESSSECLIEIQKKLECDTLISGKVAKLGDEFILSLNTVNVNDGSVGIRTTAQAKDVSELKTKLPTALDEILGIAELKPMFQLKPGENLKLAVMPLAARGVETATADALTAILSSELNSIQGVSVISQDDIKAMLAKAEMDSTMQCSDSMECIIEIGASLGLSKLITGSVGKVKNTWVISVQLIDTRRAEVDNRVLESFDGEQDELRNAIKLAAYQIAGIDYSMKKGGIDLSFNVKEAVIQLGSEKGEIKQSQYKLTDVVPGRYSLKVIADPKDYIPFQTDIYIAPGANNVKNLTIMKTPTPWYKTWWFWTVTGVVVLGAAAATTTVLMLEKDDDGYVEMPMGVK